MQRAARILTGSRCFSTLPQQHHVHSKRIPAVISVASDCIVQSAQGSYLTGTNGRKYLDFSSGIAVTNLGHSHPKVLAAARNQLDKGVHLQINCVTSQPVIEFAEKVGDILPPGFPSDYQVLYANSGAESIENAIKIARVHTKKQTVIVFGGGFHGRTIGAGALTTAKNVYRGGFQPSMAGVYVAPFPYTGNFVDLARSVGRELTEDEVTDLAIEDFRRVLKQQTSGDELAAILIEPILGEGGYVPVPKRFLQELRRAATEYKSLLVLDEVQTGYGRTGTHFACEQFDVVPDIIVSAKGIANGFPLSMIIASASIFQTAKVGSFGGTYGGNSLSCAVASAVLDIYREENILENVRARGEEFRQGLRKLQSTYPIREVRGLGLMNAIEFKHDVPVGTSGAFVKAAVQQDLLCLTSGIYECVRFIPPLNVSKEQIALALEKIERALKSLFKTK